MMSTDTTAPGGCPHPHFWRRCSRSIRSKSRTVRASGCYARDGRKILDFYGGHAVAGLGYGHPRWPAALERQARQMAFQTNALPMARSRARARRLATFTGCAFDTVFWSTAVPKPTRMRSSWPSRSPDAARPWRSSTAGTAEPRRRVRSPGAPPAKWYGFPRTPFDVSFTPRNDPAAHRALRRSGHGRRHRRADARGGRGLRSR